MSTRKLSSRLNTNSPTLVASTESNSLSQSPSKLSPIPSTSSSSSLSPTLKTPTDNLIQTSKDSIAVSSPLDSAKKRRRRTSLPASPSISPSVVKKSEDNDEILSTTSDLSVDDKKIIKIEKQEDIEQIEKDNTNKEVVESPSKSRRKKYDKSSMVTRNSTPDPSRRSLRCIRRDSQGRVEGFFEFTQKRPYRRKANLNNSESPTLPGINKRKKDEDIKTIDETMTNKKIKLENDIESVEDEKTDDNEQILESLIKTENNDEISQDNNDENDIKKDDKDTTQEENKSIELSQESEQSNDNLSSKIEENAIEMKVEKKIAKRGRPKKSKDEITPKQQPIPYKRGRGRKRNINDDDEVKEKQLLADDKIIVTPVTTKKDEPLNINAGESFKTTTELLGEGLNEEIYKKPEFLENNQGIEKDPKLSEIVQKVDKDDVDDNIEKIDNAKDEKIINTNESNEEKLVVDKEKAIKKGNSNILDINESLKVGAENNINLTINNIEKDEMEASGSGDSLKESDILQVLEEDEDIKLEIDEKETEEYIEGKENSSIDAQSQEIKFESKDNVEIICDKAKSNSNTDTIQAVEIIVCDNSIKDKQHTEIVRDEVENKAKIISEDLVDKNEKSNEINAISDKLIGIVDLKENAVNDINDKPSSSNESDKSINTTKEAQEKEEKKEKMDVELSAVKSDLQETPEILKQKENHLKSLGLLTHKAAVEAKIEKQLKRKQLQSTYGSSNSSSSNCTITSNTSVDDSLPIESNHSNAECSKQLISDVHNKSSEEYTGTLKTVIKLNRQTNNANLNETSKKKSGSSHNIGGSTNNGSGHSINNNNGGSTNTSNTEGRQSLKMTFQKGRGRLSNSQKDTKDTTSYGEETYYTIQNENEGLPQNNSVQHGRKSSNRSYNTIDHNNSATTAPIPSTSTDNQVLPQDKPGEKDLLLIPEKASSFGIHPGRLCQDQCYYCGGRFGLYDTPCHVAQLKSEERRQKILSNEEKLTVDNCLCDACFRHVVRRAKDSNCKSKQLTPTTSETTSTEGNNINTHEDGSNSSAINDDCAIIGETHSTLWTNVNKSNCIVTDCNEKPSHYLRRKFLRKTVKKLIPNIDVTKIGTTAPICEKHYDMVAQHLGCSLCKKRLGKNHMHHVNYQDVEKLGMLLNQQGLPMKLASNSLVCRLCRYFINLLIKPPEHGKLPKAQFVKNYRRRLLLFHNIQTEEISDTEDQGNVDNINEKKSECSKDQNLVCTKTKQDRRSKMQSCVSATKSTVTSSATSGTSSMTQAISNFSKIPLEQDKISLNLNTDSAITKPIDRINMKSNATPVPSTSTSTVTNTISGQIILDNDVMVDYDVPIPLDTPSPPPITESESSETNTLTSVSAEQKSSSSTLPSKLQSILQCGGKKSTSSPSVPKEDISLVLRSNPNISMRELFPGEEEMGLHMNIPFTSSQTHRTPEGWTRVQTFLQYDDTTRRLWEDLQKPYGNQSSFLRHLILLEKYYRNGDLILSRNASENAVVYSEAVRNRLRSYDNLNNSNNSNANNQPKSLLEMIPKHISKLPITITTKPKQSKQSQSNNTTIDCTSNSADDKNKNTMLDSLINDGIFKSNLLGNSVDSVEILPISNDKRNSEKTGTKQQKLLAAASKLISNGDNSSTKQSQEESQSEPVNQQSELKKTLANITSSLPPQLISINRNQNQNQNDINTPSTSTSTSTALRMHRNRGSKQIPPNVIVLPETLSPTEKMNSRNWRPTLIPVTTTSSLRQTAGGPLYQTADGRRLPGLVQVQSGGRPYLISIQDYNRMCILRREKMKEQLLKNKTLHLTHPTKFLNSPNFGLNTTNSMTGKNLQHNSLKNPIQPQTSLLKNSLSSGSNFDSSITNLLNTPSSQVQILSQVPSTSQQLLNSTATSGNSVSIITSTHGSFLTPPVPPQSTSSSNSWLWNSMNLPNRNILSFSTSSPISSSPIPSTSTSISPLKLQQNKPMAPPPLAPLPPPMPSFPLVHQHQHQQQQQQHQNNSSLILDNNLLSKIPKSLTVIPQHKSQTRSRSRSRGNSIDLTSA